jgi:hypothetical protein
MDAGGASTAVDAAEAVESLAWQSRSSSGITSAGGVAEYTERAQWRRMQQAIDRAAEETGRTCLGWEGTWREDGRDGRTANRSKKVV